MVESFRDLRVYRRAFRAARRIFRYSESWPKEERYALTDQIRRSSRSVFANVAEAWRKRRYPKHFVSTLSDADAEAAETRAWLDAAISHRYIDKSTYQELDREYNQISESLVKMMTNPDQWCGPSGSVHESPPSYEGAISFSHTPSHTNAHTE